MTDLWRRLLKTPQGAMGTAIVGFVLLVVLFGPLLAPHDPEALSPLVS